MTLAIQEFRLEHLLSLDEGRVVEAFNQAVKRCALDCEDRPGVKEARKVTLTLELSPVADEQNYIDGVKARFQIKDSAPQRKSKVYDLALRRGGQLVFNAGDPGEVDQHTLFTDDDQPQE